MRALSALAIWRGGASWTDRALAAVVYVWLLGVPLLLGVGLIRRVTQPSGPLSLSQAQDYAAGTDAFLLWGLVLNAVLPAAGAVAASLTRPSRLALFGWVAGGAVVIYLVMGVISAQATAGLFGHLPRWEKP
jgi:hypothetical protein